MRFLLNQLVDHPLWLLLAGVTAFAAISLTLSLLFSKAASIKHSILFGGLMATFACPIAWWASLSSGKALELSVASPGEAHIVEPVDAGAETAGPALVVPDLDPLPTWQPPPTTDQAFGSVAEPTTEPWQIPSPTEAQPNKSEQAVVFNVKSFLLNVWLAGSLISIVGIAMASIRLRRLVRKSRIMDSDQYEYAIDQAARQIGIQDYPHIRLSNRIDAPAAIGSGKRATVLLPARYLVSITEEQLIQVLTHEGAHVIRRDPLVLLLQRINIALWWWHPLIHILNRQLGRAREEVCDNVVLHGTDSHVYGETLLELGQLITSRRQIPAPVSLFGSRWKLEHRIKGLLNPRRRTMKVNRFTSTLVIALFVCGAVLISTTRVTAQERERERSNQRRGEADAREVERRDPRQSDERAEIQAAMQQLEHLKVAQAHLMEAGMEELAHAVAQRAEHLQQAIRGHEGEPRREQRERPEVRRRTADQRPEVERRVTREDSARARERRPEMRDPSITDAEMRERRAFEERRAVEERDARAAERVRRNPREGESVERRNSPGNEEFQHAVLNSIKELNAAVQELRTEINKLKEKDGGDGPDRRSRER